MKVIVSKKGLKNYGKLAYVEAESERCYTLKYLHNNCTQALKKTSVTEVLNDAVSVGDIVVGLPVADEHYLVTKQGVTCKVEKVIENNYLVITKHDGMDFKAYVSKKHFELHTVQTHNIEIFIDVQKGQERLAARKGAAGLAFDAVVVDDLKDQQVEPIPVGGEPVPAGRVFLAENPFDVVEKERKGKRKAIPDDKPQEQDGFTVGQKVMLSPDSRWNDGSPVNPLNTSGEIIKFSDTRLNIQVHWDNGMTNGYNKVDLIGE